MDFAFLFYASMGADDFDPQVAADAARKACMCYGALSKEAGDATCWRVKPKLHMWQELAEYQNVSLGNPKDFWAYKDEDFVGFIADLALRRGGPSTPATVPQRVLARYRALGRNR